MAAEIRIELGGRERTLRYPMRSVKRLKAECGVNLFGLGETQMSDPDVMSAVLWAGLIHGDPELTVDEVDGWYELKDLGAISEAIAGAMGGGTADADPTGTSSE